MASRPARLATTILVVAVLGGCAGEPDTEGPEDAPPAIPAGGGPLTIAVADAPKELDPLAARTRSERLLARQIYEPLFDQVEDIDDPAGAVPGLVEDFRVSRDQRRWFLTLRTGVRFQDGERLNAAAVVANVQRWQSSPAGRRLIQGLLTADSPRTDFVRLSFSEAVPDLPDRLSSGRFGVVSPAVLGSAGSPSRIPPGSLGPGAGAGTGPYELRELDSGGAVLARYTGWWALGEGIVPALDQIDLLVEPSDSDRLADLIDGELRVADSLRGAVATAVRDEPLLALAPGATDQIGHQLSVKGIETSRPDQSLADVWLSTVGR